ncbi:hypothetical protein AB4072_08060 [Microvirga sp. 2MCAF38]|uniref:hypothetical protein n=1 Tax=Microvirga sp. 2MCAF38 TaxID=3232989 RepID=UPI003F9C1723
MKNGFGAVFFAILAVVSLAACNRTNSSDPPSTAAVTPAGCAGEVESYKAIMDNDRQMGHVHVSVYNHAVKEIDQASAVCAARRNADAIRMLNATKFRYGYR